MPCTVSNRARHAMQHLGRAAAQRATLPPRPKICIFSYHTSPYPCVVSRRTRQLSVQNKLGAHPHAPCRIEPCHFEFVYPAGPSSFHTDLLQVPILPAPPRLQDPWYPLSHLRRDEGSALRAGPRSWCKLYKVELWAVVVQHELAASDVDRIDDLVHAHSERHAIRTA